jgi:glutamate synthase (NADPH/NADH) large chain
MTKPNSDAAPRGRSVPHNAALFSSQPEAFGLYDPRFEHDACGVSFICHIKGRASRSIVADALDALCNLDHRGASGAEVNTGDGAGILLQVPDRFLRAVVDFPLPPAGAYGVGLAFLPLDAEAAEKTMGRINVIVEDEGLRVVGWREVPVDSSMIGPTALSVVPSFRQLFVDDPGGATGLELDRLLFVVRKRCEHELAGIDGEEVYFPSLSSRTLVY